MDMTVVVPAKYEADNIAYVLDRLKSVSEVLVVSPADEQTLSITETYDNVRFIEHNLPGKGEAMRRGFSEATCERIVSVDADGSHSPAELERAWDAFELGAGLVKGSRTLGGSDDLTWYRSAGNKVLTFLFNMLYGTSITDLCYGYIGFTRETLDKMDLRSVGFEIESELVSQAARVGARVEEFPSFEYDRDNGTSNLRPIRDGFRILYTIVRNRL